MDDELTYLARRPSRTERDLPMPDLRRLGAFIRHQRLLIGMTQDEFSDLVGIDQKVVSKWETGQVRRVPTGPVLRKVASVLGVTEEELLRTVGYLAEQPEPATEQPELLQVFTLAMRTIDADTSYTDDEKDVLRSHVELTRRLAQHLQRD